MVRATVSHSQASGTKQPYGVRSHQLPLMRLSHRSATPQKPLRADSTVIQNGRLDPRRVTASHWRVRGESRPRRSWFQRSAASAQLVVDSFVGPHRSPASPGATTLVLFQVDLVCRSVASSPQTSSLCTNRRHCRLSLRERNGGFLRCVRPSREQRALSFRGAKGDFGASVGDLCASFSG